MEKFVFAEKVRGELSFRGDKSISHRAVIFGAMAEGLSHIENLSFSEDVTSTREIFQKLGVEITGSNGKFEIRGRGFKGFSKPDTELYAGNSGTTARLLSGFLGNQPFEVTMTGDESLSKRPMKRVIDPLRLMGCNLQPTEANCLPMTISPSDAIHAISYKLPIASAQIKSAIALSALHLDEPTTIFEELPSRNHTEIMLNLPVEKMPNGNKITVSKANYPTPFSMYVPGDISSAAFFVVLGLLVKDSELLLTNVSLNPERSHYLSLLKEMGGDITIEQTGTSLNEPIGNILVRSSQLHNITIPAAAIPLIIDEIPILTICGLFAEGDFTIQHASELRVKESDRIAALVKNLRLAGYEVEEYPDGLCVQDLAPALSVPPVFDSYGDHRIAMAFAILSVLLNQGGHIENFGCVNISNPEFKDQLQKIIIR
jgi:3-phosphoshikimate 1-carboxyvinyltransferase